MADAGHEATEKIIAEMEKKLSKQYAQAEKEVKAKLDDYFRRFEAKDAKWQEWVKNGVKTDKQYKQWRTQQIAQGERWTALKEQLAEDFQNANKIARSTIDGYLPEVYAINHNYGIYQIENGGEFATSLTLYDRQTVERLMRDDPELLPPPGKTVSKAIAQGRAERWSRQKLQSVMTQGILQGESIPKLATRLAKEVGESNRKAAIRNARTMATNAQNAGRYDSYRRARDKGIDLTIEWQATLDQRTRHDHRMLHGQRREVDEPFEVHDGNQTIQILYPAQLKGGSSDIPQHMIWNCFVGDTKVASDCEIIRSYKHEYSGDLIRIRSAAGVDFTCTPNHPILTPQGWISAALLNEGDNLLITKVGDDGSFRRNGNVNHVHASIKAIHDSFKCFCDTERVPMGDFNFHGDVPATDVEVVSKKRLLRKNRNVSSRKSIDKGILKNPDAFVFGKCHFVSRFRRVYVSALGIMRSFGKPLTLFWRSLRHADIHCFGAIARRDTRIAKYSINNLPAMTNIRSELLNGLAGEVFVDKVVAVNKDTRGLFCHVYNLQTQNGYYFVGNNSIPQNKRKCNSNYYAIAKNCRCTLLAWVKGFEGETIRKTEKMNGMSFEEWLEARPVYNPIDLPEKKAAAIKASYIKEYRRK